MLRVLRVHRSNYKHIPAAESSSPLKKGHPSKAKPIWFKIFVSSDFFVGSLIQRARASHYWFEYYSPSSLRPATFYIRVLASGWSPGAAPCWGRLLSLQLASRCAPHTPPCPRYQTRFFSPARSLHYSIISSQFGIYHRARPVSVTMCTWDLATPVHVWVCVCVCGAK